MASRRCDTCNREKARHLWLASEWKKKGPARCKSCYKKSGSYDRRMDTYYQREFGITLKEYEQQLETQGGRCAVCDKKPGKRRLAVDHDHAIEERDGIRRSVRGLLCRDCNQWIGHIEDDPNAAVRLYKYLVDPPCRLQ